LSVAPTTYAVETDGLVKEFAGFRAVNGVDLRLEPGKVHALVGPNGAGKTTLFNLLTGFLRPTAGRVIILRADTTGLPPERIVLQQGRVIAQGSYAVVREDPAVVAAYLGQAHA